jgi:hypothetical protein
MSTRAMRQVRNLAHKLGCLSWSERLLLLEAISFLALSAIAIAILPFSRIGRLASPSIGSRTLNHQERLAERSRVRWAVIACAHWIPWRALCFQQGLAVQLMLRRRGIPSVLYYGVAPDDRRGLSAHVWVCDGDVNIVGGEIATRYAVLATFPPQSRTLESQYRDLA